ncbi:MAG TPA: YHS domain-containing protein [Gemmatimonadaceae bacterium]|nr:YHS domain-containing protein [Gemmatimonadaceae bacterium]
MARVKDPVCGMMVDSVTAPASATAGGETYYFCSTACEREFSAHPEKYTGRHETNTVNASRTEQKARGGDAPRTTSDGITAPKFGSAGSGGAELEPGPDRNRRG